MHSFIKNKYSNLYYKIVNYRLANPATEPFESHHIVPKSLGGTNDPSNLVRLSLKEHFVCHHLLTKMTQGTDRQKMFLALDCFIKPIQDRTGIKVTARLFAEIRQQSAEYLSSIRRGRATRPAGTYNHSDETRRKMSESSKGKVKRPAGFNHSDEVKSKMKSNRKGKGLGNEPWNKGLVNVCPHCGKTVRGTLNRWHGDRCRLNGAPSQ